MKTGNSDRSVIGIILPVLFVASLGGLGYALWHDYQLAGERASQFRQNCLAHFTEGQCAVLESHSQAEKDNALVQWGLGFSSGWLIGGAR